MSIETQQDTKLESLRPPKIIPFHIFMKIGPKIGGDIKGGIFKLRESAEKLIQQYDLNEASKFLIKINVKKEEIISAYVSSFVLRQIIGDSVRNDP